MSRKILLNVGPFESRAAIIDDGKLCELMYEVPNDEKIVGCIIKGRVANIVPATQSAFVDIGIHKDAFLTLNGVEEMSGSDAQDIFRSPIQDVLKVGQDVVLQILKEPTPVKGPRSTMAISFPGRYLVFMPTQSGIGVSRRISQEKERERLRAIGQKIAPKGTGVVFRTASEGLEEAALKADLDLLVKMWNKVEKKMHKAPPRTILHRDMPLPLKVARDFFDDSIDEMIVDNEEAYKSIIEDCDFLSPLQRASLELYKGDTPLFEKYSIEKEIERAMSRKVWLDSGSYLYIDKTEAMYCIDVNSGRFSGGADLEETVFKVNMEAAREIAKQVRLRNLSGMIIIDFIDMETKAHRNAVLKCLKEGFKGDRNKPNILDFSELGLVQMTRRRTAASLDEVRKSECPCCHGTGKTLSNTTLANLIKTNVLEEAKRYEADTFVINAHKCVLDAIKGTRNEGLKELSEKCGRELVLRPTDCIETEYFKIEPILGNGEKGDEITNPYNRAYGDEADWNDNRFRESYPSSDEEETPEGE